ncbi:MAG: VUT family protein [Hyphococcus sp.]
MEAKTAAVERRQPTETAMQRLARKSGELATSVARLAMLSVVLTPILLVSFLTADLPMRLFDGLAGGDIAIRPSNWLTRGGFVMALGPLMIILFARKYGGEEASRAVTASWGLAAIAVFAELSYLAPALEDGDMPPVRFTVAFVASAMMAQYFAASFYDVMRGGARWWRAPLISALSAYGVGALIFFPSVYWGAGLPWLNWMIGDFAIKALVAFAFLPFYAALRRPLRPRGGFGGI